MAFMDGDIIFVDKVAAPGNTLPDGWTTDNVPTADNLNKLRDACYALRTAVRPVPVSVTGINGFDSATLIPPQYWTETVAGGKWVKWRGHVYTSGLPLGFDPLFAALPNGIKPVWTVRWPLHGFIDNAGIYLYTLEVDQGGLVYLTKPLESTAPCQPDYVSLDGVCWFIPD